MNFRNTASWLSHFASLMGARCRPRRKTFRRARGAQDEKDDFGDGRGKPGGLLPARPQPPTFRVGPRPILPIPAPPAITGAAPMPASMPATTGPSWRQRRRLNPNGLAGGRRSATTGSMAGSVRRRNRHPGASGADVTFAPLEILNPWFGTTARPRRLRAQQHFVLRHARPRLWRCSKAESSASTRPNADRLGRRPRHGSRLCRRIGRRRPSTSIWT